MLGGGLVDWCGDHARLAGQWTKEDTPDKVAFVAGRSVPAKNSPVTPDYLLPPGGRGPMCVSHAATHVPQALSGYLNDVKRSGNRLVAGSFDRFVKLRPSPAGWARHIEGPGAMNSTKIARFLQRTQPATPCLVLDVDRVEENFRALRKTLPLARIYYAVKANPAAQILERLVGLSSYFDAASYEEVAACLDAGARADAISFGNTIKKASAIRQAHERGVSLFAFDSIEELEKLARHAPGARVYCRLLVENKGADWPLSRKFGTSVENAKRLMLRAGDMGLDPYGLSFHVGSQQTTTRAYEVAIARVHRCCSPISPRRVCCA